MRALMGIFIALSLPGRCARVYFGEFQIPTLKMTDAGNELSTSRTRSRRPQWRVPDRWDRYTEMGELIPGTRIIAFKTPLRSEFFNGATSRFEVDDLLSKVSAVGGKLGLVVDLTNTARYYDPVLFSKKNIIYKKISCPGRNFAELERISDVFNEVLNDFFTQNQHNDHWVGVHCTHGLNRTGYLICRYLCEVHGWSADDAVEKFQNARGHKIERDEYTAGLTRLVDNLRLEQCHLR